MALCTLHPSLTSLASNLELWDKLSLALVDSSVSVEFLDSHGQASSNPVKNTDNKGPLIVSSDSVAQNLIAGSPQLTLLDSLGEGDTAFYSEHFLTKTAKDTLANLLVSIPAQSSAKLVKVEPKTITELLDFWSSFGKSYGKAARARDLHQRVDSQVMDWTSNFYARLRGKRAIVLSSLNPLIVASSWISDIIRKIGAIAPELDAEDDQIVIDWAFLKSFDPHTIILAPLGKTLVESQKLFFDLEKLPAPDNEIYQGTSAAKRGEVYFAEGTSNFYNMDYRILKTLGVIVSACAGFESGYITDRDTFYKLRYLELHRHKI